MQNRCYASQRWDRNVRASCAATGIVYQGFSLLTANGAVLTHPELVRIAGRHGRSVAQIIFRFAVAVGMLPLTGTTDAEHMRVDIGALDLQLNAGEVSTIEGLVAGS